MPDQSRPVEFRRDIIQKLLTVLRRGESCSLIGVGSSGKSGIARHLERADVLQHYLGQHAQHILYLYVNCAKLTGPEYTARELYRLILEVLTQAVAKAQSGVAAQHTKLKTLWKEALDTESNALARHNLEEAFHTVFQAGVQQVFVALDDFDPFFAQAPAPVLNSLRALRDDHKGKLMYLTVTRRELAFLRPDPGEVEDFLELVVPATTFVAGPYSEADARSMLASLAARETPPRTLSDHEQELLLEASGHHPGLLRMIYKVTEGKELLARADMLNRLRQHPAIIEECEKICSSLEKDEWDDLTDVISEDEPPGKGLSVLLAKGIVHAKSDSTLAVFSPVLANFVGDHLKQDLQIQLLPDQQVRVNNQIVGGLSHIEYHLFSCLYHQYPKPVAWIQLLQEMVAAEGGHPMTGGPPDRRLDTYMNEVKRKIEFDGQERIVRLPNGGYRMLRPGRR